MSSPVLIVGSIALDSVETPFGKVDNAIGGAGVYASTSAGLFAPVRLVGVIGDDFPQAALDTLASRGVDLKGVTKVPGGKTFRWAGSYEYAMNEAQTHDTQLNVFGEFNPVLPEGWGETRYVFLANILPSVQSAVLDQLGDSCFVMCDTMNFWITSARDDLLKVLARVDLALMNDAEVRQLTGTPNLAKAAQEILDLGPKYVVIKKGEYGASLVSREGQFSLPCYPLPNVVDPTGAGDSFAGGLIGFLALSDNCAEPDLRRAMAIGTVMASACVEQFSLGGLQAMTVDGAYERYGELRRIVHFEELGLE
jgi:sugar/nucleoside kinase (ribokinase family)